MKILSYFFVSLALLFTQTNCASSSGGTSEGSTGVAALSLQIAESDDAITTNNGYTITLRAFALNFSNITIGSNSFSESFTADFFDEEAFDIVEMEGLSAGEYEEMTLTLGEASDLGGDPAFLIASATTNEEVTSTLNGSSIFIHANAVNGDDNCELRIFSDSTETIVVNNEEDHHVEVEPQEESEALVEVHVHEVFADLDLEDCVNDAVLTFTEGDFVESLVQNLISNFNLKSVEEGDHDHDHGHDHDHD